MSDEITTAEAPPTSRRSRSGRFLPLGLLLIAGAVAIFAAFREDDAQPDSGPAYPLPLSEAKYLQDVEHLGGFVLGDLAFPRFAKALQQTDRETLLRLLDEQFQGTLFGTAGGKETAYPFAEFRQWSQGSDSTIGCDRAAFVDGLLRLRRAFGDVSVSFKVKQMAPVRRGQLTGPWQGSCMLRLAGRNQMGLRAEHVIDFRCRITQVTESTPQKTGWLARCDADAATRAQTQRPLMEEFTADTGIDTSWLIDNWRARGRSFRPLVTGGVYLTDFNLDGRLDVLLTDLNGLALYRGQEGGTFIDVTEEVGLLRRVPGVPPVGAAFADFDNDGFPDLLLGSYLLRNRGGSRFERLLPGRDTSLQLPAEAKRYAVADYDRDGRLDLYVMALFDRESESRQQYIGKSSGFRNQMWRNLGDWRFEDTTAATGTRGNGGPAFAAVWFDANGDDWPDLMTSCEFGADDYFVNQRNGTFRPGEMPKWHGGFSMGITVGDMDNDGFGDPYLADMYSKAGQRIVASLHPSIYDQEIDSQIREFVSGCELYHNGGDGKFERIGRRAGVAEVGWAYGPAYMDLSGDGFLDVYCPAGFQSVSRTKPDG